MAEIGLSVEQVMAILEISRTTYYERLKEGHFVTYKLNGRRRVTKESFNNYVKNAIKQQQ